MIGAYFPYKIMPRPDGFENLAATPAIPSELDQLPAVDNADLEKLLAEMDI
jgi:hypothetical protein